MMLTYVPYDAAAAAAEGEGTTTATTADVTATPLVYAAVSASCTEDREGYVSLLYNVLVSSAYFERATVLEEEVHITHPTAVNKVSSTCCLFICLLALSVYSNPLSLSMSACLSLCPTNANVTATSTAGVVDPAIGQPALQRQPVRGRLRVAPSAQSLPRPRHHQTRRVRAR